MSTEVKVEFHGQQVALNSEQPAAFHESAQCGFPAVFFEELEFVGLEWVVGQVIEADPQQEATEAAATQASTHDKYAALPFR